jgi:AmmeMemoRadiSam system protein B
LCRADVDRLVRQLTPPPDSFKSLVGGLVPHAGWLYSGAVSAGVLHLLATHRQPQTVVLFGGSHRCRNKHAALFGAGRWETPLGGLQVDDRLAERILGHTNLIVDDAYAHDDEHSLEVHLPMIECLFGPVRIVPIVVPPVETAWEVGEAVARTLQAYRYDAIVLGTTDLTHYGPQYDFTPEGVGEEGLAWAKENDRRFIDLTCTLAAKRLVREAAENHNACSAGAAAAVVAAAKALGAMSGVLVEHTSSGEVIRTRTNMKDPNSVGYAGIVFA